MGNHEKLYRWQCKGFSTQKEADDYAFEGSNKPQPPLTLLVAIDAPIEFLDSWRIKKLLSEITRVNIEK
jgi:hypothetical protein